MKERTLAVFGLALLLAAGSPVFAQNPFEADIARLLETRVAKLETRLDSIETKLDLLLKSRSAPRVCTCPSGAPCTCGANCDCDPFAVQAKLTPVTPAPVAAPAPKQYRMVCNGNSCYYVEVTDADSAAAAGCASCGTSSTACSSATDASAGRRTPIRNIFQRIFHRGGRGCASCGG